MLDDLRRRKSPILDAFVEQEAELNELTKKLENAREEGKRIREEGQEADHDTVDTFYPTTEDTSPTLADLHELLDEADERRYQELMELRSEVKYLRSKVGRKKTVDFELVHPTPPDSKIHHIFCGPPSDQSQQRKSTALAYIFDAFFASAERPQRKGEKGEEGY